MRKNPNSNVYDIFNYARCIHKMIGQYNGLNTKRNIEHDGLIYKTIYRTRWINTKRYIEYDGLEHDALFIENDCYMF
jgi:hypothetical protein